MTVLTYGKLWDIMRLVGVDEISQLCELLDCGPDTDQVVGMCAIHLEVSRDWMSTRPMEDLVIAYGDLCNELVEVITGYVEKGHNG